jgi:biotin synthase
MEDNILNSKASADEILKFLEQGIFIREILENALLFLQEEQDALFKLSREKRDKAFPERSVEVRSVLEISNICKQGCNFCSMGEKMSIKKYTIEESTLLSLMDYLYQKGRRVILLQSGENNDQKYIDMVSRCVEKIKNIHSDLLIILCLGNLSREQYFQLKRSGADRYVLKFESSNPLIYNSAKPNDNFNNRIKCIEYVLEAGFVLGSGNIVGLPGQTISDIADDLLFMHKFNLGMNSSTVFIPAECSVYKNEPFGNVDLTLNTMALMRIMNPHRLMPTTSSLERARNGGQLLGLEAGANSVTIHDGTPEELKACFPIYSVKRIAPQSEHFENIVGKAYMKLSKNSLYAK